MIQFGQEICSTLDAAVTREWLETNGIGGFASSTIIGLNTRRYHGLLTAATRPPVGRLVLLSKLEETLIIDGQRFGLSANQYPGVVHPQGYQYLKKFRLDPFPVFIYEIGGVEIKKSVFMIHGENSTVIQYELMGEQTGSLLLEVRPLIAFRDYHSTMHENGALNPYIQTEPALVAVAPYEGLPLLYFAHNAEELDTVSFWFRNFVYEVERERGLDSAEDLFSPFALKFDLSHRSHAALIASMERRNIGRATEYEQAEVDRRKAIVAASPSDDGFIRELVAAADHYIVARGDQKRSSLAITGSAIGVEIR